MANDRYGFIIHPEEWKMVRDVLPQEEIAAGLFPVLDACLTADDPSQAIGDIIKTNLCARMFWDRNVRDISKLEKNLAETRERVKRYREAHKRETEGNGEKRDVTPRNAGNGHNTNTNTNTNPNTDTNTNTKNKPRSVTVPVAPGEDENGNGNGTGLRLEGGLGNARKLVDEFAKAVSKDQGAFFDPEFDAMIPILAVTGDYRSVKRWRQLIAQKGEDAVRTETFTFWRECAAGEDVKNRGATLNKRLAKLKDAKGDDDAK